ELVQVQAEIQVQQHRGHHHQQLGRQPGPERDHADQDHAQGDRDDPRRGRDAEEQQVGDQVEVGRMGVAAAPVASHEQPRQEEQAAEPDQHRADVQQLEPEVHARFLAGRIARKATRPRAKQAWAAAVGAAVLLPLPALALPVCRPPGSLAEPWAPPGAWLLPPALLLALYLAGLWRLWRRAPGRGIAPLEAAGFVAGILLLAFVLGGPLNAYARWSLGAHMAQH